MTMRLRFEWLCLGGIVLAAAANAQVRLKPDATTAEAQVPLKPDATGGGSSGGAIDPPLSPRNASYEIRARLQPATRTITGTELITWRNITTRAATELQFHLYWNAWRDNRSTWLREASSSRQAESDLGVLAGGGAVDGSPEAEFSPVGEAEFGGARHETELPADEPTEGAAEPEASGEFAAGE